MTTAPADRGQAVATAKPTSFEVELSQYEPQIKAALPNHIPVERFKRVVVTALNQNPELWQADRRSLFTSCVRAAQDGLLPDGREAALVVFNNKDKKTGEWLKAVTYMPMVTGIIKRMRNSGDVTAVDTSVVFEHDEFDYRRGDDPHILHKPTLNEPGKPIGAYAIIKLTNGEVLREVMGVAEIEKVRAVSKSKDTGPWASWWTEMARKSVLRRCAKRAPVSSDLDRLLQRDDEEHFTVHGPETRVAIPPRPTRESFAQQQIEHAQSDEPEGGRPASFTVVTIEGEPVEHESAEAAAKAIQGALEDGARRGGLKGLEGMWESNAVTVGALREAGHAPLADELQARFTALGQETGKPPATKDKEKAAEGKTAGEGATPADPLTLRGKAQGEAWEPFCTWLKLRLMKADAEGRKALSQTYAEHLRRIAEIRIADHDAIQAILSA